VLDSGNMYDLIIIGAGPAGAGAGVYAARKKMDVLVLTKDFLGQSAVSEKIYNWIGTPEISGIELSKNLEKHLRFYEKKNGGSLEIESGISVSGVSVIEKGEFLVTDNKNKNWQTKNVLICSGSSRKKLSVPGANEYDGKGIVYCATCDGPLFSDMDVAVIGGGNAGFESAMQLLAYCKSVTLLHRNNEFRADPLVIEKVLAHKNMHTLRNVDIKKVSGDKFVNSLEYQEKDTGEVKKLEIQGIFVEIGQVPNTNFLANIVDLDEFGKIKVDPWTMRSSLCGIWAAGDCTNVKYHQNNIATGDAVKAVEDIYQQK